MRRKINPSVEFMKLFAPDLFLESLCTEQTCPLGNVSIQGDPTEHQGHDCPNPDCDGEQYLCREGNPGIRHSHVCVKCGWKWQHDGQ